MQTAIEKKIRALDDFDPVVRRKILHDLAGNAPTPTRISNRTNMHLHSFYSFNTRGYSPSHLAWDAVEADLFAAGLCDFDVLDGLDEFMEAGRILGLRTTVNLETRAFLGEYADMDINSPGEPGVTYIMGAGFAAAPAPDSAPGAILTQYRSQAQQRNRALVERINNALPEIAVDYAAQVVPLTPAGAPTERHIVRAYRLRAETVFPAPDARHTFWSQVARMPAAQAAQYERSPAAMEEFIRALLVKAGGIGYQQPGPRSFPPVDDFIDWVNACRAVPMITWLDGTSPGEADAGAMLECMQAKGAAALNIIPDRNHNISDQELRARKTAKLEEIVRRAEAMHLPVQIGTEMNKDGQPFYDDITCPALRPYAEIFAQGAAVMTGHTILTAYADYPLTGPAAAAEFGNPARRNRFFADAGRLPPPDNTMTDTLAQAGPERALELIRTAAARGAWPD